MVDKGFRMHHRHHLRHGRQQLRGIVPRGLRCGYTGDANDDVGKGLSGAPGGAAVRCARGGPPSRGEHHRRNADSFGAHQRPGCPARRGRRALLLRYLGAHGGSRASEINWLRVHDRWGGSAILGGDGPQLSARHVRWAWPSSDRRCRCPRPQRLRWSNPTRRRRHRIAEGCVAHVDVPDSAVGQRIFFRLGESTHR